MSLRSSYPGVKLVLVTGICGGVPSAGTDDEMVLDDAVISETVVQYDLGRQYPDKFVTKTASAGRLGTSVAWWQCSRRISAASGWKSEWRRSSKRCSRLPAEDRM